MGELATSKILFFKAVNDARLNAVVVTTHFFELAARYLTQPPGKKFWSLLARQALGTHMSFTAAYLMPYLLAHSLSPSV